MTNFETSNQNQANLYDTPIHRPYGEEVDPRAQLAHKLEIMSQGIDPDEIEDYMFLRIAKNFVLEEQLHPALAFAQRVKDPVPRRSAMRAFDSVIHDAPTSTLPVITPGATNYSNIVRQWMVSANRSWFFVASEEPCMGEIVEADELWCGIPKNERFDLMTTVASVAGEKLSDGLLIDEELLVYAKEYLVSKRDANGYLPAIDLMQTMLAHHFRNSQREDLMESFMHVRGLNYEDASGMVKSLLRHGHLQTALSLVKIVKNGREAIDVLASTNWGEVDKSRILVSALHGVAMPLRWRIDALDEALHVFDLGKNRSPMAYKLGLLRDDYAKNKNFSTAADTRPSQL